jgi:hypothetical protein
MKQACGHADQAANKTAAGIAFHLTCSIALRRNMAFHYYGLRPALWIKPHARSPASSRFEAPDAKGMSDLTLSMANIRSPLT